MKITTDPLNNLVLGDKISLSLSWPLISWSMFFWDHSRFHKQSQKQMPSPFSYSQWFSMGCISIWTQKMIDSTKILQRLLPSPSKKCSKMQCLLEVAIYNKKITNYDRKVTIITSKSYNVTIWLIFIILFHEIFVLLSTFYLRCNKYFLHYNYFISKCNFLTQVVTFKIVVSY